MYTKLLEHFQNTFTDILKASLKRCVFNLNLEVQSFCADLLSSESLFQWKGPTVYHSLNVLLSVRDDMMAGT